mmetsp:Transcript_34133/g.57950  ORF Transcript_34133/g.57950 Transcript_34133/m.57950 type:complete len:126 (-) Transcript_34133:119-496(-)
MEQEAALAAQWQLGLWLFQRLWLQWPSLKHIHCCHNPRTEADNVGAHVPISITFNPPIACATEIALKFSSVAPAATDTFAGDLDDTTGERDFCCFPKCCSGCVPNTCSAEVPDTGFPLVDPIVMM